MWGNHFNFVNKTQKKKLWRAQDSEKGSKNRKNKRK